MNRLASAAAAAGVLAILALFLAARWHNQQPYSGDEPHYLVIANSLVYDGDVDVKDDYLSGRYLRYYEQPIDPHVNGSLFTPDSPHWYSLHGVGLPAVIAPGVGLADTDGASATMVLVAVAVVVLAFLWARRFTGAAWPAALAAAALGVSPSFLGLEGRIFPDLPTAALLLAALLLLEQPGRRPWQLLLLGALIAVSPWVHLKNAVAFGTIALVAAVLIWRSTTGVDRARLLLLLGVPAVASAVGYELALHSWYGSWLPTRMLPPGNEPFTLSEARGLAAASFDAARGLLVNNPGLLLILPGLPLWLRLSRGPALRLALVIGPSILFQATFHDWSGGFSPTGRYALQFAPALVPAIALLLQEAPNGVRAVAGVLLGVQLALAAAFVWLRPPWGFAGARSPFLDALDGWIGPPLYRLMPAFDYDGRLLLGGWKLAVWIVLSLLLVAYGVLLSRSTSPSRYR